MKVHLITEKDVADAAKLGQRDITVTPRTLITPLARDRARELRVFFTAAPDSKPDAALPETLKKIIAVGSDHSGVAAKAELKPILEAAGFQLIDVGTLDEQSCDYPDYALRVGEALMTRRAGFGVMIDGVGTASAIVLNKLPTVRAASCYNTFTARIARAHGDANALTLGARSLGIEVMKEIALTFLSTAFEAGRHSERLGKVNAIEEKYFKPRQ